MLVLNEGPLARCVNLRVFCCRPGCRNSACVVCWWLVGIGGTLSDPTAQILPVSLYLSLGLIYHRYISGDEEKALWFSFDVSAGALDAVLRARASLEIAAAVPF